jgi:phosphoribosylglycinamide formyltransferase-1
MYGRHVHRAVLDAGERQSGATIHWVTENYDEGAVIAQEALDIRVGETVESLEGRVKALERELIVRTISELSVNLCN